MPHTPVEKKRALARVRRIRGQLDALENSLEQGADCAPVLQQLAAVRGAVNGLMSSVLESHLREEFAQSGNGVDQKQETIEGVVALVRSYLR
ncbi:formaldehyde-responsive transcriptional repressor FrmR [Acetobacter sp. P1H12_c]|uniref:formaldehyde-responsive transcriptional repressor FrmR n=1 Tax=Acetobacter sp. P1H12_c TaxID=2762621 RepID=UPI001C04AC1A|nr:formaldehyde-responsive transcriptional repressor FrmR [Acetobacter sp. P1H12_c]